MVQQHPDRPMFVTHSLCLHPGLSAGLSLLPVVTFVVRLYPWLVLLEAHIGCTVVPCKCSAVASDPAAHVAHAQKKPSDLHKRQWSSLPSFVNEIGTTDWPVADLGIQARKASLIWSFIVMN